MSEDPAQRRRRPLSVWVLTVTDSLFAGVFLMAAGFRLHANPFLTGFTYPKAQIALWWLLGFAISVSAYLAWTGSRQARNALLGFMTIYLGLGLLQNANYLAWAADEPAVTESFVWQQIAEAARSVLWLAANYWFLLGRRARAFCA